MTLINSLNNTGDPMINDTNNDILNDCQQAILLNDASKVSSAVSVFRFHWINDKGVELNENFSHDNWKGVASFMAKFNPDLLSTIPVFGRHSRNPLNFLTFVWMKYKIARVLLQPIISLRMIFNCIFTLKRDAQGRPHTSGRLLDYFIAKTFKLDRTFALMESALVKYNDLKSFDNIFEIYFNDKNHYNYKVLEAYNAE